MKFIGKQLLASVLASTLLLSGSLANAEEKPKEFPSMAPILKPVMPAIVNVGVQGFIQTSKNEEGPPSRSQRSQPNQPDKPRKFESFGSGVILDPKNGLIITNDHVIRNATQITVTLQDGRHLKAKLIGGDSDTDIAVLKVEADNLKSLPIGDSDTLEVGEFVAAIGNPFGLNSFGNSQSVTFGIVSALKRTDLNIEGVENFIQTDAAINPGNSGGALINSKGELMGINTAIISPFGGGNVGIGFAIPINMARNVVEQLVKFGSVHRGLMGIFVQHLAPELAVSMGYSKDLQGALVAQVNQNSPAELAGLKAGDIITQINDTKITQATQVKITISLLRVGSEAKIIVLRDGKPVTLKAVVTDIQKHEQQLQSTNPFLYGLSLRAFEQDSPLHGAISGVQVTGATENSAGWRAGLRPGDIIVSANKQPTPNVKSLQDLAKLKKDELLVQVLRGPGAMYMLIS